MRGFTLLELIVSLAILGTTVAVAGLAVASLDAPPGAAALTDLALARRRAAETGEPVTVRLGGGMVRFFPDGSARGGPLLTDSLVLVVDALTGAVRAEAR